MIDVSVSLKQGIDLFLLDRTATCAEKSVEYYKDSLRYFTDFITGYFKVGADELLLEDITLISLNEYTISLRNKKIISKTNEEKKLSNNSIRTYQRAVKVFFNYLFENEFIDKNVAARYRFVKAAKKDKLPLYHEEVDRIDKFYNTNCITGLRNWCIIHLMLDAGLRMGEVVRLRLKDVMFENGLIFVEDSKANRSRYVPLSKKLKINLYKYIVLYRSVSVNQDFNDYKADYVFLRVRGAAEPIKPETIKDMFVKLKKAVDIERLHPHLCRHTFATSYIVNGGDLESLRLMLGHEEISTTQKYLHLANTFLYLGADIYKIDKVFFKRLE